MSPAQVRVLVADDQPLVRMGNALVLDSADDVDVISEAASGEEAVALAAMLLPDVVLMDARMPGIGGIEAARLITTAHPGIKVIVFTTFDIDEYAFGGLNAGASAFLLKSTPPETLTAAVRTVAAGDGGDGPVQARDQRAAASHACDSEDTYQPRLREAGRPRPRPRGHPRPHAQGSLTSLRRRRTPQDRR